MAATSLQTLHKVAHFCLGTFVQVVILGGIVTLGAISYNLAFTDNVHQDTPITVERARQIACPIPLPDSAQNVRYAYTHGWFGRQMYARFKADPQVCHDFAKEVIAAYVTESKTTATPTKFVRFTSPPPAKIDDWGNLGPIPWFNISRILDGMTKTDGDLTIWIDDDRGIFYCRIMSKT